MRTRPFLLCPLLVAIACAGARGPTSERELPRGDPRAAAQWAAFTRDAEERHSLRGVAKLSIDGPNASGSAKQILLVERPARLRVEVLGLLDQTLALLVTDGERYRLVRSEDRSVEQGAVHDGLLAEVAGIALTPELAVRVLLAAPTLPGAQLVRASALSDGGLRVSVAPPDGPPGAFDALDFDADAHLRRWERIGDAGATLLEARWADWRAEGASVFPHEVEVVDPARGAKARLSWSRLEVDPALDASLFAVPAP
jgi:hypothetical protein